MALAFLNRCIWRAASSGSGSFVVASAITGNRTPETCANPAVVNAATYRYFAQSDDKTQWEIGVGVYTTADDTLTRATILDSSNSGSVVTFSAAPSVFMGGPLARDMHWEIIGETTVSSNVASVEHAFDPSLYNTIITIANFAPASSGETGIYPDMAICESTGAFLDNIDGNNVVTNTGVLQFCYRYTIDLFQSVTDKQVFVDTVGVNRQDGTATSTLNVRLPFIRDLGSSAKVIHGIAEVTTPGLIDIASGYFVTYGIRKG